MTKFVDDMFISPDGRLMYVSRANLSDVVAIDLVTHEQLWRFETAGIHADHMALSPDGSRIVVSASTERKAEVLDAATGTLVGQFATGHYPHANDYSADGTRIYNSSIGVVSLPKWLEWAKGARQVDRNYTGMIDRGHRSRLGAEPAYGGRLLQQLRLS